MTTTKNIPELEQKLNEEYAESLERHKLIVAKYKEGKTLIKQMPKELTDLRWYKFQKLEPNKWYLETWGMPEEDADEFIKSLKPMGVIALPSKHLSSTNAWQYTGYLIIDGVEITIKVDGGSKPLNCRIEEIRETKEVITYKAHCDDLEVVEI